MADMPQRPRQHELEDESRNKFRALLPRGWVVRSIVEDYGTDLEVEIFEEGRATGLTFRVQLKATDSAPKRGRISRSGIKSSSLNYWRSLDVPVLVAFYSVPADKFFARWAHSYDAYYARNPDSKTITFTFRPEDILSEEVISTLHESVSFVRSAKHQRMVWPLPVRLRPSLDLRGHSLQRIKSMLREFMERTSGILFLADDQSLAIDVDIADGTLKCALPTNLRTMSIHLEEDTYSGFSGAHALAADIIVAISGMLTRLGIMREAANLLASIWEESAVLELVGTRATFVEAFLESGHLSEAFTLVEDWISSADEERREFADFVNLQIFVHQGPHKLSGAENLRLANRLRERANLEHEMGRTARAAKTLYNVAEMFRANDDWSQSLEYFDLAAARDQSYKRRGYFWRARGSVLYQLSRFSDAADSYREAMKCGDVPEAPFLLSDVLMHAGLYAEAEEVQVRAEANDFYALGERMNRRVLRIVREVVGLPSQQRSQPPGDLLESLVSGTQSDAVIEAMRQYDALDPRLWHLLAGAYQADMAKSHIVSASVVAADLERSNPALWAIAACLAVMADAADEDVDDYCDSGLKWCGSEFLDAVEHLVSDDTLSQFSTAVRERVYERAEVDRPRWPTVVRMVGEDGTFVTIAVDR